jgi:uncharacterized metal-binding protein
MTTPIFIIPCSGIGKPFGTISREATYEVVEDLNREETETMCLSLLVMDDPEARAVVTSHQCIAVDGCPLECAKKNLDVAGAQVVAQFRVIDLLKTHRDLKPKSITFLDDAGRALAHILASQIAATVNTLQRRDVS